MDRLITKITSMDGSTAADEVPKASIDSVQSTSDMSDECQCHCAPKGTPAAELKGRPVAMKCGRRRRAQYCSVDCQKQETAHKAACKAVKK